MHNTDNFSKRIDEQLKEFDEHPERFEMIFLCDYCSSENKTFVSKEEVKQYVDKYGHNIVHIPFCETCCPDEKDND